MSAVSGCSHPERYGRENAAAIHRVAEKLLERQTLTGDEIDQIVIVCT
jgi:ATP-dependent Zn protease